MEAFANLRRLIGGLINALLGRRSRRDDEDRLQRDASVPRRSTVEVDPQASSSLTTPADILQTETAGELESTDIAALALPSSVDQEQAVPEGSDDSDSQPLADERDTGNVRALVPMSEGEVPAAELPAVSTPAAEAIGETSSAESSLESEQAVVTLEAFGVSVADTMSSETDTSPSPDASSELVADGTREVLAEGGGGGRPATALGADRTLEVEEISSTAVVLSTVDVGPLSPPAGEALGEQEDAQSLLGEYDSGEEVIEAELELPAVPPSSRSYVKRERQAIERPPEPVTEYPVAGLPSPSLDYRNWNKAVAEHLLIKRPAGGDAYLAITPRILARALGEVMGTVLDAEQAEEKFPEAVAEFYRSRVLGQRGRLRVLRRNGDDGLPECIAFLALTVLAAYRMRSDEEATGLAYYVRLGKLLRCDLAGPYPTGFDPLVFESLWYFLRDWLAQRRGCQLVVPAPESGHHRFIGLPLAHVPLRSLDIEKLPDFFVWAGYQPSSEVTHGRLADDFARWVRARGALTPTGVAAFADARRPAVLAEIRGELDSWDGTCEESLTRKSAAVEILFDLVQQRPELFYVPRRPSGFPTRFDDGVRAFEASDDGWYGRISIAPQDGEELASGFIWQAPHSGVEFALRRAAASVISLAPSDDFSYSGFMSARGLRKGVRCAVLCREDGAQVAAEYLSHVTERPCSPIRHPDLPVGWSLFPGVIARRVADAPVGFESIDVQATVGLIPSGGIRLGNRWTWLHGAPPRIIVTGSEPGLTVTIDGEPAIVGEDGALQSEGPLAGLGAHVIQVGPLRRTVEIIEPSLPVDSIAQRPQSSRPRATALLALPAGSWTIVGAVPGQIARAKHGHRAGTIAETAFVPSWAIRVGPEGATVLHVFAGVPPAPVLPKGLRPGALSTHGYFSWATAIYDVAVRHPRIESLATDYESLAITESWKSYARCAGQIKRQIRRFRR